MIAGQGMKLLRLLPGVGLLFILLVAETSACTRILVADKGQSVMVGRSMDWEEDMGTNLLVLSRHLPHVGSPPGVKATGNWLTWESRFGSITATGYEDFITDGLNEAGFAVHLLWHEGADYGRRDPSKPALSQALWLLYYLDNFKSVEEAVQFSRTQPLQIVPFYHEPTRQWGKLHLVLDDASGDSAILEYVDGKLRIYHGPEYVTATNEPDYDVQLDNLKRYRGFGGTKSLPGKFSSKNRFVRASFYASVLPAFVTANDRLVDILAILNNVAYPYTTIDETKSIWRVVSDLGNRMYYFQASKTQNLLSVDLKRFDLDTPSILKLDLVNHPEYVGDVTDRFEAYMPMMKHSVLVN
ncbi:linear amide C-N hydrolase [Legionella sp. CNM-4043-24]|uniref:linear amide C-N hydrolase n=1 Tax=Legionella sp. CNM-4043-24 TaxID=3421646 RepID=UPI00403B34CE